MKTIHKKILSYYEDFKIHRGTLHGESGFFDFQPSGSLHHEITTFAYGIREIKSSLNINSYPCESYVIISNSDISRRFFLKIQAQLFDWEKYICGIEICVNGKKIYENDREFFETVNLGWPSVYIPVPPDILTADENVIKITQTSGETSLLIASADLVSLPSFSKGSQLTLKPAVRKNDTFALSFYTPNCKLAVTNNSGCEINGILKSPINPDYTIIQITVKNEFPVLTLDIDGKTVDAVMPEVFPESDDFCMVGTDSDDHRHDDSNETDRILEIFSNTNLGNFWQARPQETRNYYNLSDKETWTRRIEYLKSFNTTMSLSDSGNVMPYFSDVCKESFLGKHFHEAYLFFCPALMYDQEHSRQVFLDAEALLTSSTFGETKNLFCTALKKMYEKCKASVGLTSVGSPSLLTIYESRSGFERVTIEPVSNINLLMGAVRGASPKMWGAHVPTDWYFGEPNDQTKAKKFMLAMQLLYMHGADYIYAENSLFKTNAFSRKDWEDDFCTYCRSYQRDFYDYTIRNPREGKIKSNLAILYGNNEYFMWHYDNRMAELPENGDWDITLWGKWKDNRHHKCWRAIDAWLPQADKQNSRENVLNLNLFSGTPYGTVDIIPYESEYSMYKALVLLGWNTFEEGFDKKIYNYVKNGGTAFISYCHFNKTDVSGEPMEYASCEALGIHCEDVTRSFGKVILNNNQTIEINEEIEIIKCNTDGEKIAVDEQGNVLICKKTIGKGTLYFGSFADFNCPDGKMSILKYTLKLIADDASDVVCSNPNICFTHRIDDKGKSIIDYLNVNSGSEASEKVEFTFRDGTQIIDEALPCQIKKIIK